LILGYHAAMTRLLAFGLVLLVLLGVAGTAQDVTLKKLYDPIEDFQLEYKDAEKFWKSNVSEVEAKQVDDIAGATLLKYLKKSGRWKSCQSVPNGNYSGIHASNVNLGSFTQLKKQQRAYRFTFCEPYETYGCDSTIYGVVILEGKSLIAMYTDESCTKHSFSVSDINQNGLNELMLEVPDQPDSEKTSIRLLEFPNGAMRNLGDLSVDIYPSLSIGSEVCGQSLEAESTKKTFNSNIIFVLKSKNPLFFSEKYKVNCNYSRIGAKAQKIQDLTPIKPIQRFSGFKRIY
jgi:hypothetical protein